MCEPPAKRQRVEEGEEEEVWKIVPGHDNFRVSSKGMIVHGRTGKQKMTKYGQRYGKLTVTLNNKNVDVCPLVTRVFSITPARDDQTILHHTDMDRRNFSARNIKWVSPGELAAIISDPMEKWIPIPDFSERYFISSKGRVMNILSGEFMSQTQSPPSVLLRSEGEYVRLMVHRTMVSLFSIKPKAKDETIIHHVNFNRSDNALVNLRFISEKELTSLNMKRSGILIEFDGKEEWKRVAGFPRYFVSSYGRVINALSMEMSGQHVTARGYSVVHLSHGRNTVDTVRTDSNPETHRIVARTFLGNPRENETVDHINRIKTDNRISNLRYASPREQLANRELPDIIRRSASIISTCLTTGDETIFTKSEEAAICLKVHFEMDLAIQTIRMKIFEAIHENCSYMNRGWSYDVLGPTGEIRVSPSYPDFILSSCGMLKKRTCGYWRFGTKTSDGYMGVSIDGCRKLVHRLLLEAFRKHDPSPDQIYVNHRNGERSDNRVVNLEYVSPSENIQHAHDTGLSSSRKSVIGTDIKSGVSTMYLSMASAGRETVCSASGISLCCLGKLKTTSGYLWRYA